MTSSGRRSSISLLSSRRLVVRVQESLESELKTSGWARPRLSVPREQLGQRHAFLPCHT